MSTATPVSDFVPAELDATRWPNIQPLYQALLDRELKCEHCLETLLLDRSELDAAVSEAGATLYINMTRRTDDKATKQAYLDFVENVQPNVRRISFALDQKIVQSPHVDKLDPQRYRVMLRDLRADVELFRDENVPLQTRDTTLDQQFSEICGGMIVQFDGEERTLPQMNKYLEENDRTIRENAWRGIWQRRAQDANALNDIFDEMIALRHQVAQNAGFDNYRDYAFKSKHRFDYTPEDCEAFHNGAETVCVPLMRTLNRQRTDALKVDPLRPWDLGVDTLGRPPLRPFSNADELIDGTSKIFHELDGSLGTLFDRLRTGDCLDLESRPGKAPGGYQYQRDFSREPFIFMNAAGLHRDLETMVHEAGHAFHSMLSQHDPLVHYRHAPIEFAEVASMSMELLAHPYLGAFYDETDAARARRRHLESLATMLPWIATIDAFQHWLYTHPRHTRAERTAKWLELDARFGPAVDWTGLEDFRAIQWQRQLHLFSVPFYYIEYGIAQLGALQLWMQARRDESLAIDNYTAAMKLGGSRPLPELFQAADLEFNFGPTTMQALMDTVQEELESLPL
jgi:oligoendopeptidase F